MKGNDDGGSNNENTDDDDDDDNHDDFITLKTKNISYLQVPAKP